VLNAVEATQAQAGTYASPGLTEARIFDFYKDASFGAKDTDILRTYSPTAGVTVVRDASFGVPHIFGPTATRRCSCRGTPARRTVSS